MEIKIFENDKFGNIRIVMENNKPLFCGKDVAEALGYANPRKALADHCKGVTKRDTPTSGGVQSLSYIPEGDLYRLIAHSQLPSAQEFESWVFDEVLPSIRKHGMYLTPNALDTMLNDPNAFAALANRYAEEYNARVAAEKKIEEQAPKVLFADCVSSSQSDILVGELAKLLKQNGIPVGQNRLFKQLRKDGYLISRKGTDWNMPTQRSMELGLMRIKETPIPHSDGHVTVNKTPKITGKGQVYFVNRYADTTF